VSSDIFAEYLPATVLSLPVTICFCQVAPGVSLILQTKSEMKKISFIFYYWMVVLHYVTVIFNALFAC